MAKLGEGWLRSMALRGHYEIGEALKAFPDSNAMKNDLGFLMAGGAFAPGAPEQQPVAAPGIAPATPPAPGPVAAPEPQGPADGWHQRLADLASRAAAAEQAPSQERGIAR